MKYMINDSDHRIFQNRFYDVRSGELLSPVETQNYTIVQAAESYYTNGFFIGEHRQICDLELTFSYINGLTCSVNGVFETVEKQSLHLTFGGETHALKSSRGARFQTLAINFKKGPCLPLLHAIQKKAAERRTFRIPECFGYLSELLSEFLRADTLFLENHLDSLITAVLVRLARFGEAKPQEEISSYDIKTAAMKKYMDTRFLELCSLEELSYHFGYTYSYLSKLFKKAHGVTPADYLLKKKMDYACEMLKEGAKLEEIAAVLGYSTSFNFSRAFKNHLGISPTSYKKQNKTR